MWSSAFTSAKIIVSSAPPLSALSLRFLVSGLLAIGIGWLLGQSLKLTSSQWKATVIFGICQNSIYLGLNFIAVQRIEASVAAIIASTMPLIVAFLGWIIFRDRLKPLAIFGLVLGFIGVLIIMNTRIQNINDLGAISLCVLGAISLAIATLSVKNATSGGNLWIIVGYQMIIGSIALLPFALLLEEINIAWSFKLIIAFFYTTLIPGLLATWVWFVLVSKVGAVKGATYHFLNPFFGVLIAYIILKESIGLSDYIGVIVVSVGIIIVQISRNVKN
ncbi:DMT family transporter [Paracoccaceae bacterium]|jgi:drug/metabolite transporter (DMT)-like permease|nr:DMT family transporter [Paracoccaceae bacterium]